MFHENGADVSLLDLYNDFALVLDKINNIKSPIMYNDLIFCNTLIVISPRQAIKYLLMTRHDQDCKIWILRLCLRGYSHGMSSQPSFLLG